MSSSDSSSSMPMRPEIKLRNLLESADAIAELVNAVATRRGNTGTAAERSLNSALEQLKANMGSAKSVRNIPVARFKDHKFRNTLRKYGFLGTSAARVWALDHEPLRLAAVELARANGLPISDLENDVGFKPATWEGELFEALVSQLSQRVPGTRRHQAELMLFVICRARHDEELAEAGVDEDADEEDIRPGLPDRFASLLGELEDLSADAPEWGHLDAFFEALKAARTRVQERAQGEADLARIAEALAALSEDEVQRGVVRMPTLGKRLGWKAETWSGGDTTRAVADLQSLAVLLRQLAVCDPAPGSTREELQRVFDKFTHLENSITALVDGLAAQFEGAAMEPAPASPVEVARTRAGHRCFRDGRLRAARRAARADSVPRRLRVARGARRPGAGDHAARTDRTLADRGRAGASLRAGGVPDVASRGRAPADGSPCRD